MKLRTKLAATALAATGLVVAGTSNAWAVNFGSSHAISGTCYESGAWYVSNTIRTQTAGADSSRVEFIIEPTNGIDFYVHDYNTGKNHGILYNPPLGTWYDLAYTDAPYQFQNVFRLHVAGYQSGYNFSGTEDY